MGFLERFRKRNKEENKGKISKIEPKVKYEDFYQEFPKLDEYLTSLRADEKFSKLSTAELMDIGIKKYLEMKNISQDEPEVWNVIANVSIDKFFSSVDKSLENAGFLDWDKSIIDFDTVRVQSRSPFESLKKENSDELDRYSTLIFLGSNRHLALDTKRNYAQSLKRKEQLSEGVEKYKTYIGSTIKGRVQTILESSEFNVRKYDNRDLNEHINEMLEVANGMKAKGTDIETIELSPDKVIKEFMDKSGTKLNLLDTCELTKELYDRLFDMSNAKRNDFDKDSFRILSSLYFAFGVKEHRFPSDEYRKSNVDGINLSIKHDIHSSEISNILSKKVSDKESLRFKNMKKQIERLYNLEGKYKEEYRAKVIETNKKYSKNTPQFFGNSNKYEEDEFEY